MQTADCISKADACIDMMSCHAVVQSLLQQVCDLFVPQSRRLHAVLYPLRIYQLHATRLVQACVSVSGTHFRLTWQNMTKCHAAGFQSQACRLNVTPRYPKCTSSGGQRDHQHDTATVQVHQARQLQVWCTLRAPSSLPAPSSTVVTVVLSSGSSSAAGSAMITPSKKPQVRATGTLLSDRALPRQNGAAVSLATRLIRTPTGGVACVRPHVRPADIRRQPRRQARAGDDIQAWWILRSDASILWLAPLLNIKLLTPGPTLRLPCRLA